MHRRYWEKSINLVRSPTSGSADGAKHRAAVRGAGRMAMQLLRQAGIAASKATAVGHHHIQESALMRLGTARAWDESRKVGSGHNVIAKAP